LPHGPGKGQGGSTPGDRKNKSLEFIFQQMLKANLVTADSSVTSPIIVPLTMPGEQPTSCEKESEESLSPGKDLSTRFMNYEQIMKCLGRKTLAMRKAERRKIQEEQA